MKGVTDGRTSCCKKDEDHNTLLYFTVLMAENDEYPNDDRGEVLFQASVCACVRVCLCVLLCLTRAVLHWRGTFSLCIHQVFQCVDGALGRARLS